jgi:hypothetical protein
MVWERIGPKMVDTPEAREKITKMVNQHLDKIQIQSFDHQFECSTDPEFKTLRVSFRMPPGFYTPEKVEELRAAGVVLKEAKGE